MSDQPTLNVVRFRQGDDGQLIRLTPPLTVPAGVTVSVSVEDASGNVLRSYLQTRRSETKY